MKLFRALCRKMELNILKRPLGARPYQPFYVNFDQWFPKAVDSGLGDNQSATSLITKDLYFKFNNEYS
jgi:hypothetical protein